MAQSLYDVLGVSPNAAADEIRRAYIERARQTHPDRHIDANGAQRVDAERRMREVNEAWRVLGNVRRRRRYDLERAPETRFASRADGTMANDHRVGGLDDGLGEIDGTTRIIRGLPWLILVVVMLVIFVFTAYAATGGTKSTPTPTNNLGRCVTVATIDGGRTVTPAACGSPGARLVISEVDTNQQCPAGSERLQPITGTTVYCLEV